jgi:apolipoprotein N-acyltransferase
MNKPFFDNIRWGEITTGLMGLSGFLTALVQSPIPEKYKPWVMVAVSVVAFLLAFLRNPKSLEWVDEAQEVAAAVQAVQKPVPAPAPLDPKAARMAALQAELSRLEDAQ